MKKAAFEIWPNFARGDLSASLQKNILNQNVLRANCFILQLKVFALLIHRLFLGLFYEFAAYSNEHRLCSLSLLGAFCSGPWLHRAGGHYAGGVGAPITVFNPQDARNRRCQLCLQMCRPSPLPVGSRGFAKSDDTRGSGNLYVPPSGLSPNPTGDIRPGHEPQITCERVCALTLTLWCHAGTDRRVTEHRDRSCRTHWGQGREHGPSRKSFAGGPVPLWLGLCPRPFSRCTVHQHPSPRPSHLPSHPNPSARFPGARCSGGGCWPRPPPLPWVFSVRFARCAATRELARGGLDAASPTCLELAERGQGGEGRVGSSSCWSVLGWDTGR